MVYIALLSYFRTTIILASYLGLIIPFFLVLGFLLYNGSKRILFPVLVASIIFVNLLFTLLIVFNGDQC